MNRPKILIVGKLPPPYFGPAIATEIIINSSLKQRFSICHHNSALNKKVSEIGKFRFAKIPLTIWNYISYLMKIIRHQPNIVLIPISQATVGFIKDSVYIVISRLFLVKTVLHLRGSNFRKWITDSPVFVRMYVSVILKWTQAVIVLGNNLKYLFKGLVSESKIFVVPNGANFQFTNTPEKSAGGQVNILYLGNLLPAKGIEDILDAVNLISRKKDFNISLDVIGAWSDENTKKRCLELTEKNNLPITFHPPASGNRKLAFLKNADVFVFTPRDPEGHPWVIVEALAAGLPIIATDKGAIVESVIDNHNGYIVESRSPEQIAKKLTILIDNIELRTRMGKKSRSMYLNGFTEEKMVNNLTNVFEFVL